MRKLLVSTGLAPTYTAGVLSAGSVDILKKPAVGQATPFNPLLVGDSIADSDSICFVQGTAAGVNIQTPWIPARDIVRWTGRSYTAQAGQFTKIVFTTNATVAGTMSLKLVSVGIGQEQFERKTYEITVAAGATPTNISTAFAAAITADLPSFLVSAVLNVADLDLTGKISSSVTGQVIPSFQTVSPEGIDGSNGTTYAISALSTAPDQGSGDGDLLVDFEKQLQGDRGFYNRITQPNTPVSYIAAASNYDLYSLTFLTGPVGQIKGVDNKREIIIAYVDGGADQLPFETKINGYLATAPGAFAAVTL
jgi:hypothetical protein